MELAVPILPADDLASARAFYVDALGFTVRFEATDDGRTGLLGVARGSIWLTIDAPMSGHGRQACASLLVDDADAYFTEWRDRVPIQAPPRDEPWGARTFSVHDPAGNTIFVIGPLAGASRRQPSS
jgi:catechol 2,3-dioxygenase-like lactoylglutathione lyase family enzyme